MTPSLVLGDSALDEDHARLEQLIVQLRDAPPEQAVAALDALRAHADRHFSVEDLELRAMQDGNAKCHLDEHAAVLKSLDEVKGVLTQNEVAAEANASLVRRLAAQLLSWLPEHVHEMDAGVASHRSKQRFGGAPVKIARRPAG
jgi:hemerythrin